MKMDDGGGHCPPNAAEEYAECYATDDPDEKLFFINMAHGSQLGQAQWLKRAAAEKTAQFY